MQNKVELIGTYGGDLTHALSAWTSTSRDLDEKKRSRIPKLLTMLATEGHHTPFEKSMQHFLVTSDIASHIHMLKHRIGVSINAESARYKELQDDKYYIPDDWDAIDPECTQALKEGVEDSLNTYHTLIENLVGSGMDRKRAKESARFALPYANQITCDISFNFRSFMHFQGLRNDDHAQKEIREIAQTMLLLVRKTGDFDESLKAFGY